MSKTPITDANATPGWQFFKCAPDELVATVDLARRLELDRSALMKALSQALGMTQNLVIDAQNKKPWHPQSPENLRLAAKSMRDAIAAARANFPTGTSHE